MTFAKKIAAASVMVTAIFSASQLLAQTAGFPSKPVRIIVPFPPGGLADALTRGIAQELSREWPQPVIVENKPGANNIIAADATAKSAPDGYTIFLANDAPLSSNQYLYSKLPYDPVKDFTPVINVAETVQILVAGPAFTGRNLNDFLASAKAKPGVVSYGSYGSGSKAHIDTEALALQTGISLLHVPYKGVADIIPALLGGQIQSAITGIPPVVQLIQSGQLKGLAVGSPKRLAILPNVPTFDEQGVKGFYASAWFGLVAPAATPRPIINKIAADISRVISRPDFQTKYISGVGLELLNQGPDQFAAFLQKDRQAYAVHVKNINVKLD